MKKLNSHAFAKNTAEIYYRLNYKDLPRQIRTINIYFMHPKPQHQAIGGWIMQFFQMCLSTFINNLFLEVSK